MGLSLRNIGKSITDVLGGVERQVNPFDHGATYSTRPAPAAPRPAAPGFVFNGYSHTGPSTATPAPAPIVFGSKYGGGMADIKTFNANNPAARPGENLGGDGLLSVIRPVLRSAPDLRTLLTHKDFQPQPGWQQDLFGKEKVQTFSERQKGIEKVLQNKHGIWQNLATPLSIAGTGANIAMDVASVVPAAKVAQVGVKAGIPAAEKALAERALLDEKGFIAGPKAIGFGDAKKAKVTFKGPDGKTRFEVDDSKAGIVKNWDGTSQPLDKVLKHDELYKKYPYLKNVGVDIDNTMSASGSFDGKTIKINPEHNLSDEDIKATLLHEIQHAIQDEEGFASGGGIHTALTPKAKKLISQRNELDDQTMDFMKSNPDYLHDPQKLSLVESAVSDMTKLEKEIKKEHGGLDGREVYRRLAGEAESRNVENRMNLSPRGRELLSFNRTLYHDVPKKDQIVIRDNAASSKAVVTSKLSAKELKDAQVQLNRLQGKAYAEGRPLTKSEQIKEGLLMEKIHGKPKVTARSAPKPKVTKTTRVTEPVTPLQKESPYAWTLPITSRLDKMGGSARDLSVAISNKRNIAEKGYAMAKFNSPTANSLSKEDFVKAVDHLEGTALSKDPKIVQAATEMQQQFDKVHALAQGLGKDVKFRDKYFPHFNTIPNPGDGGYDAALKHLVKTGQAKTTGEAAKLLDYSRTQGGMKKFASFEKKREADLPDYPKTQGAYHHYLEQAYAQIGHYHQFGANDDKLKQLLTKIHEQGGDLQKVTDLFNRADSRKLYDPTHEKISSALTTFQGATKLGTSFLGNAAQQGNNIIAGGLGRTVKAASKGAFSKADRDFVRQTGVTGEGVAREAIESRGTTGVLRKVTAPFFEPVEKSNRAVGALTGRDQARSIAGRLAKARAGGNEAKAAKIEKQLREKFNIQGKIGDKLTPNQEIDAARKFVERTQFRTGAQDLPVGATSPMGRVVTQFKRYPYKQTGFIGREIIKPLVKEGNPLPLVRAATVALPAGYGANTVRNKITGRDNSQESVVNKVTDAAQAGGVAGLETSIAKGLDPAGSKSADAYTTKAAKTVGGPTVGDSVNLTKAGFTAVTGKGQGNDPSRFTALERLAVGHIPDVGPTISNKAMPYKKADGTNADAAKDPGKALTVDERIKLAFTSPEDKKFLAMSTLEKQDAARADPNVRQIYNEWQAIKTAFATPKLYNAGLDPESTSVLNRDDRLTAEGRKGVNNRDNGYEYTVALAKYNNNRLDPNWTDAQDIKAQHDLAKKKVGSNFDNNTRDIYALSKQEIYDYLTSNPDGEAIAKKLNEYDQALLKAGLISTAKFKNGFSPAAKGSGSGGSRSRSTASGMEDTYKYAISTKATSSSMKKPTVTAHTTPLKSRVKGRRKTTVTLKKSKV